MKHLKPNEHLLPIFQLPKLLKTYSNRKSYNYYRANNAKLFRPEFSTSCSSTSYLVDKSDGPINFHYADLLALEGGVAADAEPCTVLGHKFPNLRQAETDRKTMEQRSYK